MKNLEIRQQILLFQWGFKCTCAICLEETQNDANHIYERFAELQKKQEMFGGHQNFVSFDITKYVLFYFTKYLYIAPKLEFFLISQLRGVTSV